ERQQAAFDAERERWIASGQNEFTSDEAAAGAGEDTELPEGSRFISAVVPGSVWKILVAPGDSVAEGDTIAIFESMKMEIPLLAQASGELVEWLVGEGMPVNAGQRIAIVKESVTTAA
ncbi:MAG: acetyl-CoA carboxylase biotin carboxyl carrier protein subunit, partial [Massilia sp.]